MHVKTPLCVFSIVCCVPPAVLPAHRLQDPPNRFHCSIENKNRNERLCLGICSITLQRMYFRPCFKMKELKTEAWRGEHFPRGTQTESTTGRLKSRVLGSLYTILWPFLSLFDYLFLNYFGGPISFFFVFFHKKWLDLSHSSPDLYFSVLCPEANPILSLKGSGCP